MMATRMRGRRATLLPTTQAFPSTIGQNGMWSVPSHDWSFALASTARICLSTPRTGHRVHPIDQQAGQCALPSAGGPLTEVHVRSVELQSPAHPVIERSRLDEAGAKVEHPSMRR